MVTAHSITVASSRYFTAAFYGFQSESVCC